MAYLVGTDEAGYGPNLGPLVISATVWRVASLEFTDLYSHLRSVVLPARTKTREDRLIVADSKALYKSGRGLALLERGVLTFLAALDKRPRSWRSIWLALLADRTDDRAELPWYRDYNPPLPVDLPANEVASCAADLCAGCKQANCIPIHMESRAIFPHRFNQLLERHGNKATALSHTTLDLVRSVLQPLPPSEPVYVLCDKHGGRHRYGPLLQETFPETLAIVRHEGRQESVYQLGTGEGRREFTFRAKGESFLPAALASMVSKYLRELAMRAFNDYWIRRVTDLKPTAGYPVDAQRFKHEIGPLQKKLRIADQVLWRSR